MLEYCHLDPWDQTSMKVKLKSKHFNSRKCIWKCCFKITAILSRPQCVNADAMQSQWGRYWKKSVLVLWTKIPLWHTLLKWQHPCFTIGNTIHDSLPHCNHKYTHPHHHYAISLPVQPTFSWYRDIVNMTAANSLAPGRSEGNFTRVYFKLILWIDVLSTSSEISGCLRTLLMKSQHWMKT